MIYIGKSDLQGYAVTKKIALNFIHWFKKVSEDEKSKFKLLILLYVTNYSESFLSDLS